MNLTDLMPHTLTHWAKGTPDKFNDASTFGTPTEYACRWQEKQQQFRNEQGELKLSKAVIYMADQISTGDWIFLGSADDADPRAKSGAFEVLSVQTSNSIDGTETLYKVML